MDNYLSSQLLNRLDEILSTIDSTQNLKEAKEYFSAVVTAYAFEENSRHLNYYRKNRVNKYSQ